MQTQSQVPLGKSERKKVGIIIIIIIVQVKLLCPECNCKQIKGGEFLKKTQKAKPDKMGGGIGVEKSKVLLISFLLAEKLFLRV